MARYSPRLRLSGQKSSLLSVGADAIPTESFFLFFLMYTNLRVSYQNLWVPSLTSVSLFVSSDLPEYENNSLYLRGKDHVNGAVCPDVQRGELSVFVTGSQVLTDDEMNSRAVILLRPGCSLMLSNP